MRPLGGERVPLSEALNRVLAEPVVAGVDVPNFDRSNVDGFAVRAADTAGASERAPKTLRLTPEVLTPGVEPRLSVEPGTATLIATGGMLPRGADAIAMVEHTDVRHEDGRTLVEVAFGCVDLDWQKHVVIDPALVRPAEVDLLIGDPTKAKTRLGWEPEVSFTQLVERMVRADVARLQGSATPDFKARGI